MLRILLLLLISTSLKAQSVYKTPSGTKYHTAICHMVKNVSQEMSLLQAVEMGLGPCKICKPQIYAKPLPAMGKAKGQAPTVQCKGFTKTGTRCKHMTRIANGYCFQHNPD